MVGGDLWRLAGTGYCVLKFNFGALHINSFKTFLAIFAYKLIAMVTIIKKGTSREKIMDVLRNRKSKTKGIDLKKYCGSISLNEDPLEMQKKWRDEWE